MTAGSGLPAWLAVLIAATTIAAVLLAIQLVRAIWTRRDRWGAAGAALGLGAFAADFVLGARRPSLHGVAAYGVAAVFLANLAYAATRRDRAGTVLVALGLGLLVFGIALARIHFGRPLW